MGCYRRLSGPLRPSGWSDLTVGRELTIRYAVLVLRLFVAPVYLIFTRDGRVFRAMVGRLLPVAVDHGSPRAIDGELALDPSQGGSGGDR